MGYSVNPNGSDFTIVTDVLQYSVFATLDDARIFMGPLITKKSHSRGDGNVLV